MARQLRFFQAINEALDVKMAHDPSVYIMGLGVPDPKGVFGTTLKLQEKYGCDRVMDMPVSENGMTGVAIGSALVGMRPVMVHQRFDFVLLAMDQIVNQAAKWHYTFNGGQKVPLVIRLVVGRGWGQGPQHSQSLHAWFAHIPGLKVVMPFSPHDAKGLLIAGIEDDNPVIFIEHRWLHNTFGEVPEGIYRLPLGSAAIVRPGKDMTIVAVSFMVLEALECAQALSRLGIEAEVIDVRTILPLDVRTILDSVKRTGRLMVADTGWKSCGFASEVVAIVVEELFDSLRCPPKRMALMDCPVPTTPALSVGCYPDAKDMAIVACQMVGIDPDRLTPFDGLFKEKKDVPDESFMGPF